MTDVIEEILNAQAELQMALGLYRLEHGKGDVIERRMNKALSMAHLTLFKLGRPMLSPARHPDVEWPPCRQCISVAGVLKDIEPGSVTYCDECGRRWTPAGLRAIRAEAGIDEPA